MKIAMVSLPADPFACLDGVGGGGVAVDCLSRALTTLGHQVSVYRNDTEEPDNASLPGCLAASGGVRVAARDAASQRSGVRPGALAIIDGFRVRLEQEWSRDRPDVVHAHSWMSGKAAVAAARPFAIPVVQTFYGLHPTKRSRSNDADASLRADAEAALIRAAAAIVATSSAEVFALLEMDANPGTIKLVPRGVELELFTPAAHRAVRSGKPFRIVTLSRLAPDAGAGDVIEALQYVDGVELAVGGGPHGTQSLLADRDARALAALARGSGVAQRVSFRGCVERGNVASFLRSADVVICAPWHDSAGSIALEAMACGVPVVVSAVGCHLDVVADGMTGIHVPPRAPRQIAYAIEALKMDVPRRARFGRFGAERAWARYGWSRIAAETCEIYRSVAARNTGMIESRA